MMTKREGAKCQHVMYKPINNREIAMMGVDLAQCLQCSHSIQSASIRKHFSSSFIISNPIRPDKEREKPALSTKSYLNPLTNKSSSC